MLSVAVLVAAISTYNAARRAPAGEYGRLFGSDAPATNSAISRNVDVIQEGSVDDERAADPMLVAPAAREQQPLANTNAPVAPRPRPAPVASPSAIGNVSGHGTTIVGDGSGVAVVRPSTTTSTATRPVLSGGIFKQQ